ncbi:MAG: aminopeptidase P family protein [Tunicatimonas sp.]
MNYARICLSLSLCLALLFGLLPAAAQDTQPDDLLSSDFHQQRREALRAKMPDNSVTVVFANPVRNRANDVDFLYHQDPTFYYLTGHRQPHSMLLLFKDAQRIGGKKTNELLLLRPPNALDELYNGKRLRTDGGAKQLGIRLVRENPEFRKLGIDFGSFDQVLFYDFADDVRDTPDEDDLYDLIETFKQQTNYPTEGKLSLRTEPTRNNLDVVTLDSLMRQLREIKTPEELDLLRKAVKISALGQREVMKALEPGMSEREVQGMHEFIYKKYQAEYEGYPSIVGAGHNGCVLHYIENYKPAIEDGELILMDLGAEYHGYTADVTRTLPVNGKFTPEQKQIYDLVYQAQEAGIAQCRAGNTFKAVYEATARVINEGLVQLGLYESTKPKDIIDPTTGRNRYYPHGCCHHIGLDVHDQGTYDTLRANMVVTIEPGIYIPEGSPCDPWWWNIPVRIEDDFLVTDTGCENLSDAAPRKSEEIEAVMAEPSFFNTVDLPTLEAGE